MIEHIDIGLDWLEIGMLGIRFGLMEYWEAEEMKQGYGKGVDLELALIVADTLCVTPYFEGDNYTLNDIELMALTLVYEISPGILLKAGEMFGDDDWENYASWAERRWGLWSHWGDVLPYHWQLREYGGHYELDYDDYEEYFAIEVSGDSCCGSSFDVFVYSWFDTDQTGAFMDWEETVVGIQVGVGQNTTVRLVTFLDADGLDQLDLIVGFVW